MPNEVLSRGDLLAYVSKIYTLYMEAKDKHDEHRRKIMKLSDDNKLSQSSEPESNPNTSESKASELDIQQHKCLDFWDASLVTQKHTIKLEGQNRIGRALITNYQRWYSLFSAIATEGSKQYHWRIKINHYNRGFIGILDADYVDEHVEYNNDDKNENYFVKSSYGYGIDASGNLLHGGKNSGKYCFDFKTGDIVDVYLDMKQFVLWYGLNGKEYEVACKFCIGIFGSGHAVELISCETYWYSTK